MAEKNTSLVTNVLKDTFMTSMMEIQTVAMI